MVLFVLQMWNVGRLKKKKNGSFHQAPVGNPNDDGIKNSFPVGSPKFEYNLWYELSIAIVTNGTYLAITQIYYLISLYFEILVKLACSLASYFTTQTASQRGSFEKNPFPDLLK